MVSELITLMFVLLGNGNAHIEELRMMANLVLHCRELIPKLPRFSEIEESMTLFLRRAPDVDQNETLLSLEPHIRAIISHFNSTKRLRVHNQSEWPRHELKGIQDRYHQGSLPPPTPCEYIDESLGWWNWGMFDKANEWIGHGWWWRSMAGKDCKELDNMAGSSMNDYDLVEPGFVRLRLAKVICADYDLLQRDFPQLITLSKTEINEWLLTNCAYVSEGQVARLSPGGDHHELLDITGLGGITAAIDTAGKKKCGIRQRSGGRAATFLVDEMYSFDADGYLKADFLDVKGLGTHINAAAKIKPELSGLLGFADALKEMAIQQLVQRLGELESQTWKTIQTYALIDTGLKYVGRNPATGWVGERCVLTVRQPNSRVLASYGGYNFSGILLMTGEDPPAPSVASGCAKDLRRVLLKYGVSSEQQPRVGFHTRGRDTFNGDSDDLCVSSTNTGDDVAAESFTSEIAPVVEKRSCSSRECKNSSLDAALSDIDGFWNLQADAALVNFMDFSDFYVLPGSSLPAVWRMSEKAYANAWTLERTPFVEDLFRCPALCRRVFGCSAEAEARAVYAQRLRELSADQKLCEAAISIVAETKTIKPGKPKHCQCWWMELDDSAINQWVFEMARSFTGQAEDEELLTQIRAWLPQVRLQ
jgi:hypothetical protein